MKTRTFRLDDETLQKLEEMADNERVSVNVVVARFLRQQVEFSDVAEKMGIVTMPRSSFTKVMTFLTDHEAEQWGRQSGEGPSREFELAYFGKETLDGFLTVLKLGEQYQRNYKLSQHNERDGTILLVLNHSWGIKWSHFYHGVLDERLKALTNNGQVKSHLIIITDNQVTVTIIPKQVAPSLLVTAK